MGRAFFCTVKSHANAPGAFIVIQEIPGRLKKS